ncbi:MAG TPA: hypothetical protein C5S37_06490 [Methanophagales archaeon]|nr:hypothetical protein [Methanophagales archaeon]
MTNNFFYLKLGNGNCLAEYWLKGPNVVDGPAAAIYFGTITAKKISELSKLPNKKEAKEQFSQLTKSRDLPKGNQDFSAVEDFIRAGDNPGNTTFITITGSKLYIYEPDSRVSDMPKDKCKEYDKKLGELSQANTAWTKKNIKKNIEKMKIKFEKPERLFSVDARFEDELNKDILSEELKAEFKKNNSYLPNKVTITKEKEEWKITGEKIYCIKKENGKLSIYSKIRNIPKIMSVKHCNGDNNGYPIAEVPHVLATLPCNQRYTRGTCRKIDAEKDWGAIQAIKHVLDQKKIIVSEDKLIELLSPYELETLVFLILKNAGLFVPAWRGGTQKGIDIIARNFLRDKYVKIPRVIFEPRGKPKDSFTFQVKKYMDEIPGKVDADFLVVAKIGKDDKIPESIREKILDAKWLLELIKSEKQQETKKMVWRIAELGQRY